GQRGHTGWPRLGDRSGMGVDATRNAARQHILPVAGWAAHSGLVRARGGPPGDLSASPARRSSARGLAQPRGQGEKVRRPTAGADADPGVTLQQIADMYGAWRELVFDRRLASEPWKAREEARAYNEK